jgi:hypothetical protein
LTSMGVVKNAPFRLLEDTSRLKLSGLLIDLQHD